MSGFWMVRAGKAGFLADDFEKAGCIAVGWDGVEKVKADDTIDVLKAQLLAANPDKHPSAVANVAAMIWKFAREMEIGDKIVTYDQSQREYLLGEVAGPYHYDAERFPDHDQLRAVKWKGRVSRDHLSTTAKNTLGSTLSIFEPGDDVLQQLEAAMRNEGTSSSREATTGGEGAVTTFSSSDQVERSREFIKDRIVRLAADEMEKLVAALLRAMGYKARVTPTGPDRGRDVEASPDGLGMREPRIVAEVKHRRQDRIGAQEIRSFLSAIRQRGCCGLYISTGGFTKEARYESERSEVPLTLLDLDELARLVADHYDKFDVDGQTLLPLVRIYWPVDG